MDAETRKYLDAPWESLAMPNGDFCLMGPDGFTIVRCSQRTAPGLELADVAAYLLELKRDRERLNWLETRGLSSMDPNRERYQVHSWRHGDSGPWMWTATRISSEFKSLRDAIDAAEKGQLNV